jgi:hypothetical protein
MKLSCHQNGAALMMLLMMLGVLGSFFAMHLIGQASQQVEKERATQKLLVEARDALLGFAATFGRLPCPASATSNGLESPVGGGACTNPYNGFVPAATLGLSGSETSGYLLDRWGGRVRYAVTIASTGAATTTDGIKTATTLVFGPAADVRICTTSTGVTATTCGAAPAVTTTAVAVLYSLGENGSSGVVGRPDEAANQNADQVFISHPKTDNAAANGEFDDLMLWLPPAILFDRMTRGLKLP